MSQVTVTTIQLFGGHPALDFTNTVDSRGARFGPDVLDRFDDLLAWGLRVGVIDATEMAGLNSVPAARGDVVLTRAKALREALYRMFAARPPSASADLALLQREVRAAQRARTLVPHVGGYAWRWQPDDPDIITHRIALASADLLTEPALARVHVCPGENCAWLFLDSSPSGRRVWCSEETCGRRSRIRRWRSRHEKP